MIRYLYLKEVKYVDAWVNGGMVPISLASTYLAGKRDGIYTPDENLIHESAVPIPSLKQHGIIIEAAENITITNITSNGVKQPDIINANYYKEDGLILSFSNICSEEIAKEMEKKACVEIINIEKLRQIIDKQLGCKGIMDTCKYTSDHNRNHFLKSYKDSWQNEFRIFWKTTNEQWVKIPRNSAKLIKVFN
jgi:hypothetical protein